MVAAETRAKIPSVRKSEASGGPVIRFE
jgi:hypothetical protein